MPKTSSSIKFKNKILIINQYVTSGHRMAIVGLSGCCLILIFSPYHLIDIGCANDKVDTVCGKEKSDGKLTTKGYCIPHCQ